MSKSHLANELGYCAVRIIMEDGEELIATYCHDKVDRTQPDLVAIINESGEFQCLRRIDFDQVKSFMIIKIGNSIYRDC